jgi:serine phosphatase RsbU (regulator of sigma subunit)
LLAFTDGVTEAGRSHGQLFQGQLHSFLDALPAGLSAGQVVVRLLQALQIHAGAVWPEDDTTLLCLHRR